MSANICFAERKSPAGFRRKKRNSRKHWAIVRLMPDLYGREVRFFAKDLNFFAIGVIFFGKFFIFFAKDLKFFAKKTIFFAKDLIFFAKIPARSRRI